ncbi:MAG TPA: WXG100 family type VII secretion target [Anaerolineae bacterium]|nr:WXG100 family type VII secretion target [Anaerolineae bacterium]HMR63247.1 WXG100 family type VII secretion target [Anaerolineae bacterium]
MTERIEVRYDAMEQFAAKFQAQAQSVAAVLQRVGGTMQELQNGGWAGRGSDAFFAEMNGEVLPAVQRLQAAMEDAQQNTRRMAEIVQQAEDEAAGLFRQQT